MRRPQGWRDDRGSLSLELVVASLLFFVLVLLVTGLGRMAHTRGVINGAARDAARAASLARDSTSAHTDAVAAANAALSDHAMICANLNVAVDVASFSSGGEVTVNLSCSASLAGLGLSGLPGSKTFTASARSPIDTFRSN